MEFIQAIPTFIRVYLIIELIFFIVFLSKLTNKVDLNKKNINGITIVDAIKIFIEDHLYNVKPVISSDVRGINIDSKNNIWQINSKIARTPIIQNIVGLLITIFSGDHWIFRIPQIHKLINQLIFFICVSSIWINYNPNFLWVLIGLSIIIRVYLHNTRLKIIESISNMIDKYSLIDESQRDDVKSYLKYWTGQNLSIV